MSTGPGAAWRYANNASVSGMSIATPGRSAGVAGAVFWIWPAFNVVQLTHQDVRGHDRGHAGLDRLAEGPKLHVLEPGPRVVDRGQVEVRVEVGVAVAGEVLGARRHATLLQPLDHGRAQTDSPARARMLTAVGRQENHRRNDSCKADERWSQPPQCPGDVIVPAPPARIW